jgi:hypothetical protein
LKSFNLSLLSTVDTPRHQPGAQVDGQFARMSPQEAQRILAFSRDQIALRQPSPARPSAFRGFMSNRIDAKTFASPDALRPREGAGIEDAPCHCP